MKDKNNVNVVCIVQARMGSERLPGKTLKKVLGKPMLSYTIKRLQQSKLCNNIVVATSTKAIDDPIENLCKELGVNVFRGSEDNVLERYILAALHNKADIVVRVTGDCPLIDWQIVDDTINVYLDNDFDYVRTDVPNSCIRGFDVEVTSTHTLKEIKRLTDGNCSIEYDKYREHVTYYICQHEKNYKIGITPVDEIFNREYRLCVDTQEDFEVINSIYENMKNELVTGKEIVEFLDRNPDIANINAEIKQRI